MDGNTITAVLGFLGIAFTAICGVYAATRTNKTEKEDSAKQALEQTRDEAYEQRLLLRDEQIAERDREITVLRLNLEECEAEVDRLNLENSKLKGLTG